MCAARYPVNRVPDIERPGCSVASGGVMNMLAAKKDLLAGMLLPICLAILLNFQWSNSRCETYQDWLERANSLFEAGKYDSAIAVAQIARREATQAHGARDTSVATAVFRIGGYYYALSDLTRAEEYWLQSLAMREQFLGWDDLEAAKCLNNLANVADINGQYARAESLYVRAIRVRKKFLGPGDLQVGRTLNGLAITKMNEDRYPEAAELFTRALEIVEQVAGPESPETLRLRINLGLVFLYQGKYDKARETYQRVIATTEKIYGPDSRHNVEALNGLALVDRVYGSYADAESLLTRSISILEKAYGPDHPRLCVSLLNLGNVYRYLGQFDRAEEVLRRYIEISEKSGREDGFGIAQAWTVLARIYYDKGDSANFLDEYNKASAFYNQTFDLDYQLVASGLQRFSWHFRSIDAKTCLRFARRAYEIRRNNLRVNYAAESEYEMLHYAKFMRDAAANFLSCYFDMDAPDPEDTRQACDVALTCKGQVSEQVIQRRALAARTEPRLAGGLEDSLNKIHRRLSGLYVSMARGDSSLSLKTTADSLRLEKGRLESLLAERSLNLSGPPNAPLITSAQVASALPDDAVLLEFMKYSYMQRNPDTVIAHYLVTVLKPSGTSPSLVDLGPAEPIDNLIAQYHQHMETIPGKIRLDEETERNYRRLAKELSARIWRPIEKEIVPDDLVLIAPDGALDFVSFAGLMDSHGKYLVESHPMHYLSSGRDIIRFAHHHAAGEGLLIMGDADFDASPADRMSGAGLAARPEDTSFQQWPYIATARNIRSRCEQLRDNNITRLPGTRSEIARVAEFWQRHYNDSIYSFADSRATEENFKQFAPGRRVIHLATHGFYTPVSCFKEISGGEPWWLPEFAGENPLLLSGLLLAGCNAPAQSADNPDIDDGVLTAEEISGLDLSGVDWVVLSACESGMGEVETGEGVYGLRRAFQVAGARIIISSLWPVGDKTTTDFMTAILTDSNQPFYRTIRQYQLQWIEKLRSQGYPDHPYLWAAFITTGDWR